MTDAATEAAETPDVNADAGRHAAEQAKEYDSVFASHTMTFDDGTTLEIPPQPSLRMLDDDCLEAYDRLIFESESYDRADLPERSVKDADGNVMTLPAEPGKGALLGPPYRKDGKLISPPWEVQEVQAVLGPEAYAVLRSKTIKGRKANAGDVRRIWNEQGLRIMERQKSDSKSPAGADGVAAVPASDSQ